MTRFKYEGRDRSGRKRGVISAPSKKEAMMRLKNQGIRVISAEEVPETLLTKEITLGNPVKLQQMVVFLRQFSTLLKAGVTVVDATRILSAQTSSKALSKVLSEVEMELKEGIPLSEAFAKHRKIFEPLFINMLKAGEATGSLDETLERLGDHYEKQHTTRQKVIAALSYPAVVGIIAIGVVIFLLLAVVPTFVDMFADMGSELPLITRIVLGASEIVQKYWYVLVLLVILGAAGITLIRRKKETKYYLDYFILRIPVFGSLIQKAALARMTRTFSSLFSSSVPILQSMVILERVVENEVIARVIKESRDSLESGGSLTEPMKDHWAIPPLVSHMISIGEETGSLDAMLSKIADFYEKEVEHTTDQLKSLIEPLMIVVLAGLVGTIVTAIMVPMFEMFNNVQNF
ncbi:type II secretion system protein F [[Bacillus] enclensis]|uniref:Type IV pilus assembly protein PilC n=1 Tax=[Bacillus] enclensis TaxID=1402860 RepID=A0A0V8HP05_9BACI|nr:type II secretion system F family protein [[Bacillus] enclensis]KSU63872.1 type II secretion system protein F [[Bacillus] enclensis]QWC21852.1 type II secretion system F family protein [Bacillus haikouensis]SCB91004.1 type IV pilus assembly protein PilC [[Bacillus] enclensis]